MLATVKADVEANWKNTKWITIAAEMEKKGATKYPAEFLMKEWKKLEAVSATAAAGAEALLTAAQEAVEDDDGDDAGED